jgi:putative ABC transport system permease protein
MNNTALALTFTLVLAALLISYRQRLDMEKDMIIGSIRAVLQLTLVGFVLKFVFNMDNAPLTGLILLLMV